jgi:hypothetical protein
MSLTVPKAGLIAGRAAQPQIEASQAGAAIARFGDVMMQVGTGIENDRLEREMGRSRLDMMEGLNTLRLEFEQMGDPDAIDREFAPRSEALRTQIMDGIDPKIRDKAGLVFDELRQSHGFALGARAIDLRQSERMAGLMRATDVTVRTAASSDPNTADAYLAQFNDHLEAEVAAGVISPEEKQQRWMQALADVDSVKAQRLLADDPAALVAAIESGGLAGMDPERAESFRTRGISAVSAAQAKEKSEADRAEKERVASARDVLKEGIAVYGKGRDWSGTEDAEVLLQDPAIAALPEAREYAHAQLLHRSKPGFSALPLAEQRAQLAEAKARPIGESYEADLVDAMQASINAAEKGFAQDRFAYAAEIGLKPAPELPDPEASAPEDMARGLLDRKHYAISLRDAGFTEDLKFFSPDEAEAWKAAADPAKSPAERTRLATAFAVAMGPEAEDASAEIGADPLFTYVGGMVAATGNATLARQIFEGQRALDSQDTRMPAAPIRRSQFFRDFSGVFEDGTVTGRHDEAPRRDAVIAAADALYAYRRRGDPDAVDNVLNEDVYRQAVHEVMGGSGTYGTRSARGGLQEVRGRLTQMAPGLNADEVEDGLSMLREQIADPRLGDTALSDFSATGNVPTAGGQSLNPSTFDAVSLRWVDGTAYELVVENPATGRLEALYGHDGMPYLLDLSKVTDKGGRGK